MAPVTSQVRAALRDQEREPCDTHKVQRSPGSSRRRTYSRCLFAGQLCRGPPTHSSITSFWVRGSLPAASHLLHFQELDFLAGERGICPSAKAVRQSDGKGTKADSPSRTTFWPPTVLSSLVNWPLTLPLQVWAPPKQPPAIWYKREKSQEARKVLQARTFCQLRSLNAPVVPCSKLASPAPQGPN